MASVFIFLTKLILIFVIHKTVDATLNCEVNETTGIILPPKQFQSSNFNCQSKQSIPNVTWHLKGSLKSLEDKQWMVFNCKGESNVTYHSYDCVHGPLDPPTISGEDNLVAGRTTNLTCTIYNVYPAPNIEWFLGPDNDNIPLNAYLDTTLDNSSSLFNATSSLSFTPRSQHYGQNLTCIVFPPVANFWTPINASIQLHVPSDSGQSDEIRVENATSSSLFISWVLKHNNITITDISLGYCPNSTTDSDNVTTSEDMTCPDYKEVTHLNGSSYNLTGLEPFQWYKVTLLVGGKTVAWKIASTAPPLPEYYGVLMTFTPQNKKLKITRLPIRNRTLPSDLCFVVIQTQDQIRHNCSNGCCKPGSKFSIEDTTGYGLVSSGRGLYSLPSPPPLILNSTRGILDMPHITIVMGAVLGAAVFIFLSSVALLLFLNFICKGIACLGKKGGYEEDDETLVRVIHKDNSRKVDKDGLVYVDIVHDHAHPDDAPPIRTEEPTLYASLDRNAMGSRKKDDDGLVYIEVSHDNAHPPDAPPIQTEKPTVYASLDMEVMATSKEKEEKGEEGGVKDEEDGVENEIGDVREENYGIEEDKEGVMGETDGVKEKKEEEKKVPEDPSPATTKQPNYENITLLSNDDGLAIPMETRL